MWWCLSLVKNQNDFKGGAIIVLEELKKLLKGNVHSYFALRKLGLK